MAAAARPGWRLALAGDALCRRVGAVCAARAVSAAAAAAAAANGDAAAAALGGGYVRAARDGLARARRAR